MAKLKYSDEVFPIVNKHFGYTFQPNHYGQSMFPGQKNNRARYPNQSNRQHNLQKAIQQWRNMAPGTVAAWNAFAAAYQQPTKRNPALFLTGYQLFLKRNHYCFLNHGIDSDFMLSPTMEELEMVAPTFELKAGSNQIDITELYVKNFGLLPAPGQWLIFYSIAYSDISGQFFEPIKSVLQVEEVFIDGLFLNLILPANQLNITYSVYLSKPVNPGSNYGGTKIRYMGCFTSKTFLGLTDTPSAYTGEGEKVVAVKADESGLEFIAAGGGGGLPPATVTSTSANSEAGGVHTHALDDVIAATTASYANVRVDTKGRVTQLYSMATPLTRFTYAKLTFSAVADAQTAQLTYASRSDLIVEVIGYVRDSSNNNVGFFSYLCDYKSGRAIPGYSQVLLNTCSGILLDVTIEPNGSYVYIYFYNNKLNSGYKIHAQMFYSY